MKSAEQTMIEKRDAKAIPHLEQYAPVWLVNQRIIPGDEAILFDVVFENNLYGWVRRRYRFDAFNNVLYYRGQTPVHEEEALRIQEDDAPYITVEVSDLPNAYGG